MKKLFCNSENVFSLMKQLDLYKLYGCDMTSPEFLLMHLIDILSEKNLSDMVYVSDIVERTNVTPQAVSKLMKNLESKGYIKRSVNQADRRRTEVIMTGSGKEIYDNLLHQIQQFLEKVLEVFESDEYDEFMRLSKKFETSFMENVQRVANAQH